MSDTANAGKPAEAQEPQGTEQQNGSEQQQTPTVEELLAQVEDLKKHSRKWEERAKENFEAKKELDKIRESQMTEDEKRQKVVEDAERRASEAEERATAAEAALARYKIAVEFGLSQEDSEALEKVQADEETLRALAERIASRSTSGPRPNPAQGKRGGSTAPATTADKFAAAIEGLF